MKKSTLDSVESLILLWQEPGKVLLRAEDPIIEDQIVALRRRRRVRRILHRLRAIKRVNSALHLDYYRLNDEIYVHMPERSEILFDLMWPQNLPQWQRVHEVCKTRAKIF